MGYFFKIDNSSKKYLLENLTLSVLQAGEKGETNIGEEASVLPILVFV